MIQHQELASGRWAELSLCEQMAHIGSEVSRAMNWRSKGRKDYSEKAAARALELLFLSIDATGRSAVRRELTRLHEVLVDDFYGDNHYGSTDALWRRYFDHFNFAARNHQ